MLAVPEKSVADLLLLYLLVYFIVCGVLCAFKFVNVEQFNLIDLNNLLYAFDMS